ncbi:MAG: AAA family ATPase [Betaproteobacteria bacterium]|nr:AAA family ATPase [Betaproteobacteria bacterium]
MTAPTSFPDPQAALQATLKAAGTVIFGKERQIRLALACFLAHGHLLIEDLPGVGKTTLAHTLAQLLGLAFSRIQFTSDLLPADILGVSIFERERSSFKFLPGPIFAQLVLADEINRATPKAQSALLEAMEERQVTAEGETRRLPDPFFVIATQNPMYQIGTFPLPESQLDRFLMRIALGYPEHAAERALLEAGDVRQRIPQVPALFSAETLRALQKDVTRIHAAPPLFDYIHALVVETRSVSLWRHGLSPRAALALLAAARAWACIDGRDRVLPEDVQAVFSAVAAHRLSRVDGGHAQEDDLTALIHRVPLP